MPNPSNDPYKEWDDVAEDIFGGGDGEFRAIPLPKQCQCEHVLSCSKDDPPFSKCRKIAGEKPENNPRNAAIWEQIFSPTGNPHDDAIWRNMWLEFRAWLVKQREERT